MDVILRIVGMADHNVSLFELLQQLKGVLIIFILVHAAAATVAGAGTERDMAAEDDRLGLRIGDIGDIALQPRELRAGETGGIVAGALVRLGRGRGPCNPDIVHRNNVDIATVKGIILRAKGFYIGFQRRVLHGLVIRTAHFGRIMVMVADGYEERNGPVAGHDVFHGRIHRIIGVVAVENIVTERHRIDVAHAFAGRFDLLDGFGYITGYLTGRRTLRITDHQQAEVRLCRGKRLQEKVHPEFLARFDVRLGEEVRVAVRSLTDLVGRRRADIHLAGTRIGLHLIHAVGIGLHPGKTIGNGNTGNAFARGDIRDKTGDGHIRTDGRSGYRSFRQRRDGGIGSGRLRSGTRPGCRIIFFTAGSDRKSGHCC